jgi:hypothetical protein
MVVLHQVSFSYASLAFPPCVVMEEEQLGLAEVVSTISHLALGGSSSTAK